MSGRELSKTLGLVGSGIGAVTFLAFGLMQGVLIGGTAGLQFGSYISGDIASRVFTALGMVVGASLSAVMFVSCGFAAGRLIGYVAGEGARKDAELPRPAHN